MNPLKVLAIGILATASCLALSAQAPPQGAGAPAVDLRGLWEATLRFGPDVHGPLLVLHRDDGWRGDISGFSIAAAARGGAISFALPDGKGSFRGERHGERIDGFWIQPPTQFSGNAYATPVTLLPAGNERWRGFVAPLDDRFTFYLPVIQNPDGSLGTYLRNPERNQGRFQRVSRIDLDAGSIPFEVAGQLDPGSPTDRLPFVAVSVNGTIRAVTRAWQTAPEEWVATPPLDAWRNGANSVDVLRVDESPAGPLLRRCTVRDGSSPGYRE